MPQDLPPTPPLPSVSPSAAPPTAPPTASPTASPTNAPATSPAPAALLAALQALPRPTTTGRLFHGRGGLHPGAEDWTLDWFDPVWLLTCFRPADDAELAPIEAALAARWACVAPGEPLNLVFQQRDEIRVSTQLLAGQVPEPHRVEEDGARYQVHLLRGLNHGLFLDMAAGRRWVREHVASRPPGLKVLNLFAYTCAFSVAALQAGAAQVVNLDMAGGALAIGKANHALNGLGSGAAFWPHDVFTTWGKIGRSGPYDLIIADPPSHQKGSFLLEKDYPRLVRRLPGLLAPGGHALLCLNSPKRGEAYLRELVQAEAPGLRFVERVANPEAFADVSADRALKVMVFEVGQA